MNYLEELLDTAQHRPDAHTLAVLAAAGVDVDQAGSDELNRQQQRSSERLTHEHDRQRNRDRRKRHTRGRRRHDEGSSEEDLATPAQRSGRGGNRRDHPHEGVPPRDKRADDRRSAVHHGGAGARRDTDGLAPDAHMIGSLQSRHDAVRDTRLLEQHVHSPRQPLAPHIHRHAAYQQRQVQQQGHDTRPGSDNQRSGYADGSWLQLQAEGPRRWHQEPEPQHQRQTQRQWPQEEGGSLRHQQQQYPMGGVGPTLAGASSGSTAASGYLAAFRAALPRAPQQYTSMTQQQPRQAAWEGGALAFGSTGTSRNHTIGRNAAAGEARRSTMPLQVYGGMRPVEQPSQRATERHRERQTDTLTEAHRETQHHPQVASVPAGFGLGMPFSAGYSAIEAPQRSSYQPSSIADQTLQEFRAVMMAAGDR